MGCDHYEHKQPRLVVQYSHLVAGWCVFEQIGTVGYRRRQPQRTKEEADALRRRRQDEAALGLVPGFTVLALTS